MVKNDTNDYQYASVLGVSVLVGVIIISLFILRPLYAKNIEMRAEKNKRTVALEALQERERVLLGLKDKAEEIKEESERVSKALPASDDIGRLFIQLDELAKISGGDLSGVSSENSTASDSVTSAGVGVTRYSLPLEEPSYFAFKKFLESSEEALRLLSINDVRVDSSESGILSINLNVESYTRLK